MRQFRTIAVILKSSDIFKVKNLYRNDSSKFNKNLKVLVANLDVLKLLKKTEGSIGFLNVPEKAETVRSIQSESVCLTRSFIESPSTAKAFTVEGINVAESISNQLKLFLIKMISAYLIISRIKKTNTNFKLVLFKRDVFGYSDFSSDNGFYSLAFFLWAKIYPKVNFVLINDVKTKKHKNYLKFIAKGVNAILDLFIFLKNGFLHSSKKIVFVLPANHAVELSKLFKDIENRNIDYLVIVHNLKFYDRLRLLKDGVKFISRESLVEKKTLEKVQRVSCFVKKRWHASKDTFKYLGQNSEKNRFLKKVFEYRIDEFLQSGIKKVISDLFIAKKIVAKYNFKLLVTTTDPDSKILPFVRVAKLNKIRTLVIQHGTFGQDTFVNFKSDKILVWGKYYKSWFKKGLSKRNDQISITGSPFFDDLKIKPLKQFRKISKHNWSILILLSGLNHLSVQKTLEFTVDELVSLGIGKVFIRPHPWQDIAGIEFGYREISGTRVVLANRKSLDYYIAKAHLVVTANTTAGFRALFWGKPIVYWHIKGSGYLPFEMAGIPVAEDATQIVNYIISIKTGKIKFSAEKRQKLIRDVFFKLDGLSSQRVLDEIISEVNVMEKQQR